MTDVAHGICSVKMTASICMLSHQLHVPRAVNRSVLVPIQKQQNETKLKELLTVEVDVGHQHVLQYLLPACLITCRLFTLLLLLVLLLSAAQFYRLKTQSEPKLPMTTLRVSCHNALWRRVLYLVPFDTMY